MNDAFQALWQVRSERRLTTFSDDHRMKSCWRRESRNRAAEHCGTQPHHPRWVGDAVPCITGCISCTHLTPGVTSQISQGTAHGPAPPLKPDIPSRIHPLRVTVPHSGAALRTAVPQSTAAPTQHHHLGWVMQCPASLGASHAPTAPKALPLKYPRAPHTAQLRLSSRTTPAESTPSG